MNEDYSGPRNGGGPIKDASQWIREVLRVIGGANEQQQKWDETSETCLTTFLSNSGYDNDDTVLHTEVKCNQKVLFYF